MLDLAAVLLTILSKIIADIDTDESIADTDIDTLSKKYRR